jgi:mannose-6-phosphate isomerase-like protein (cupin superfamily)/N-acetylglutamate synthase-like GNAT family acetyltransferase
MTTINSTNNAEHYTWGQSCDGWHLHQSDELSVIQELMPPGTSEALHYHNKAQQVFYILSGLATFQINNETITVAANESIHVPQKTLHCISNRHTGPLSFMVVSQPKAHGDRVDIIPYTEELKEHVKLLNVEWLEKYFRVEEIDVIQLSNPTEEIINKAGFIYYARHNNVIVGTVSLLYVEEGRYELAKMAVTDMAQGLGVGNMLMQHCFNECKRLNIQSLVLYSNRSLRPAIHLYHKYGFSEIELETGHYDRANIKMEKVL